MLNALMEVDPDAMQSIFGSRVPVSRAFVESKEPLIDRVVYGRCPVYGDASLGVLGVINGLVADGRVAAVYEYQRYHDARDVGQGILPCGGNLARFEVALVTQCQSTCPHDDQCRLEAGHDGGHNHTCPCNEPNAEATP